MKARSLFKKAFAVIALTALVAFPSHAHTFATDPGVGEFTVVIPDAVNAHLTKQSADNAVVYKFKKADGSEQFLFSITKMPEQQWLVMKDQLRNARIHTHKNGFVYYVERTDKSTLRGADKETYSSVYNQLDAIVNSIVVK